MNNYSTGAFGFFEILVAIGALVLTIAMIVAILQLPKIAKYSRATMKLNALIAKQQGADINTVRKVLFLADEKIFEEDKRLEESLG